jgi:hypothetical protein
MAFPMGIPILIIVGLWQFRLSQGADAQDDENIPDDETPEKVDQLPKEKPEEKKL